MRGGEDDINLLAVMGAVFGVFRLKAGKEREVVKNVNILKSVFHSLVRTHETLHTS